MLHQMYGKLLAKKREANRISRPFASFPLTVLRKLFNTIGDSFWHASQCNLNLNHNQRVPALKWRNSPHSIYDNNDEIKIIDENSRTFMDFSDGNKSTSVFVICIKLTGHKTTIWLIDHFHDEFTADFTGRRFHHVWNRFVLIDSIISAIPLCWSVIFMNRNRAKCWKLIKCRLSSKAPYHMCIIRKPVDLDCQTLKAKSHYSAKH